MSDSTWINLVRGNTLATYMHLEMRAGKAYRFASDYTYVEIPLDTLYKPDDEAPVTKALRNQKLQVIPACTVNVRKGYKILVRTNPKLQAVANCPAMFIIDPDEAGTPSFYSSFQKDFEASELDWAVRLYLL